MGRFGSRLVMDGVLGAAGLNTGNRIGLQDLMIKDQALASPKDFALEMAGAAVRLWRERYGGSNQHPRW